MAHPNEVPDNLKDSDHTLDSIEEWEQVRAEAERIQRTNIVEDIDVPGEEEAFDEPVTEWDDEVLREDTLTGKAL